MPPPPSVPHRPLPYDHADDPFISTPETSAGLSISFDSRKRFWRNMLSLSWRCLATALSLSLLIIDLRIFSRMGELSQMEQREFNSITILLSAFSSLGLGSLIGYLGSMLRWRLLARRKYKMQDIELLLAMQSPTGSVKLLFEHVLGWRLSLTTLIVMLYLLVNITGRFSVATFGLTYNLVDELTEEYPARITNWTSSVLLVKNATDFDLIEKSLLSYLDLVRGGLAAIYPPPPELRLDVSEPQTLTAETYIWLEADGIDPIETGGNVSFEYHIPEFVGGTEPGERSSHPIHSSARCTMLRLEDYKYWRDYGNDNQTSKDWKDEKNGETIAEVLRVLNSKNTWPCHGVEQVIWAAPLAGGANGSSVTYVIYHETAWECTSILSETPGNPHPEALFDSPTLFLLPMVERVERSGEPEPAGHSDNSCGGPSVGGTASIVYRSFTDLKSLSCPSVGVQALNFYKNGTGGSATQKSYYNLFVAALIARLPIAAIAFAREIFPRIQKDPRAHLKEDIKTTLEVKWDKVVLVAGTIVASQILAITAVLYYCRNVYVREDSYLTTAELLKTVLNKIDYGNMMTMEELGGGLDKVLGGPVSYGTVPSPQGYQPRVALGREVDYNFPEFPPFRKRSVFRWGSRQ